ncbi:VOC family protein [Pectobacterium sp. B1J-3]|uniref:VOC family protein n=1 Tax=Pectobacterium sp. B1J-3 TaxID=3385371 RepID=UPI003905C637
MFSEALTQDLLRFEHDITALVNTLELDVSLFRADHIALRCHQNSTAERWYRELSDKGQLLCNNMINGRNISLFILDTVINIGQWEIDCVELPWPGERYYPHEGWEHIELVLPGEVDTFHQRALACLSDEALLTPGVKLKFSSPQGEKERLPNPTLAVTNGKVTIKFHPYDIRDVVASENDE